MRLLLACGASVVMVLLTPGVLMGQTGVGVNVGSISVDEELAPGGSYALPVVGVINTGQQPSEYSLRVTHRADQEQLRPPQEWFVFSPHEFHLDPGQSQSVTVRLNVPTTARPGEYFALVEAFPEVPHQAGVVIGVAAATRVSFEVRASNVMSASFLWAYHRMDDWSPYTYLLMGLTGLALVVLWAKRYMRIQFRIERRR